MVKLQFLQNYSRRSSPAVDFKAGDICTTIPIDEIEKLIDSGIAKPISHLDRKSGV